MLDYFLNDLKDFLKALPLQNLWNFHWKYPEMFSSDFIFRQQKSLVDNHKCQDSGHYATIYYYCQINFYISTQYKPFLACLLTLSGMMLESKKNALL